LIRVHQTSLAIIRASHLLVKQEKLEKNGEFVVKKYLCLYFKGIFNILQRGANSFTSSPKEGVLRNFIGLENSSPLQGLNPQTLGPITHALTISPSWTTCKKL
jgi:hypothetical protein